MPPALIDITVAQSLLLAIAKNGLDTDQANPRVRVLAAHEPPPSPQIPSPYPRWCRLNALRIGQETRHNGDAHADRRSFFLLITVGVSDALLDQFPFALTHTMMAVAETFDSAATRHPDTTHFVHVNQATPEPASRGEHEGNQAGILTINGTIERTNGRTMTHTVT